MSEEKEGRDPLDRYYTPVALWEAMLPWLFSATGSPSTVLDPCAGDGRMGKVLKEILEECLLIQLDADPQDKRVRKITYQEWGKIIPAGHFSFGGAHLITNPPYSGNTVTELLAMCKRTGIDRCTLLLRLTTIEWTTDLPMTLPGMEWAMVPDMAWVAKQRPTWEGPGGERLLRDAQRKNPSQKTPPPDRCGSILTSWNIRDGNPSGSTIVKNIGEWR